MPTVYGLDSETTGVDLHHGCMPYFVTLSDQDGNQTYWEWYVDPLTRRPRVPPEDLHELYQTLAGADVLVLQNAKFDYRALEALDRRLALAWDWSKVRDTLLAGHLLASNQPHDLTSMALHYLGIDIDPFEQKLRVACLRARHLARRHLPAWRISRGNDPEQPSAGEKTWKNDGWLPRAVCTYARAQWEANRETLLTPAVGPRLGAGGSLTGSKKGRKVALPWWHEYADPDHPWLTVLRDYGNADSFVTVKLWERLEQLIEVPPGGGGSLTAIYKERLKVLPITARMEARGITLHQGRLKQLREKYAAESNRLARVCVGVAATYNDPDPESKTGRYALQLPQGSAVNGSLRRFVLEIMGLRPIRGAKARTAAPTLNKEALSTYLSELGESSRAHLFVRSLRDKRKRDTALGYMVGYERFWVSLLDDAGCPVPEWFILHPGLNPTGTDTLRWSSHNPNEQNISKQEGFNLRHCFGPPPGREWWSLDAKNIEARIPAYDSGEAQLIDLFERPKDPPYYGSSHLLNFHTVYTDLWVGELGKRCDEPGCCKGRIVDETLVGPHCKEVFGATEYRWCKNGGFAVQYGAVRKANGWGTADLAFHRQGAHALLEERFRALTAHNQWCIKFAMKHGYIETIPDRSVDPHRGYPVMCSRTEHGHILATVPLNYRTQSTAMWWTMKGMIRCQAQLDAWRAEDGYDGHLVMQVHDEMVFDLPKGPDPTVASNHDEPGCNLWRVKVLAGLMAQGGDDIGIPTPVGIEYNPVTWADGITMA